MCDRCHLGRVRRSVRALDRGRRTPSNPATGLQQICSPSRAQRGMRPHQGGDLLWDRKRYADWSEMTTASTQKCGWRPAPPALALPLRNGPGVARSKEGPTVKNRTKVIKNRLDYGGGILAGFHFCTPADMHPYNCNPRNCVHCLRISNRHHRVRTCALCKDSVTRLAGRPHIGATK